MKQSRTASLTEAILNTLAGFGISLLAQWFFLPLLGVAISLHQNLVFALIMTVISILRTFGMRRLFEKLHIRVPLSPAMLAIIAERRRQTDVEGWTTEHDDQHGDYSLSQAGACYALAKSAPGFSTVIYHEAGTGDERELQVRGLWPWDLDWWKPSDRRRNLVRGGALILAEIERFDRMRKRRP